MSQVVQEDIVIAPLCSLVSLEQQIYSAENVPLIIYSNVTSLKQCLPFTQYGSIFVLLLSFSMGQSHILSSCVSCTHLCSLFSGVLCPFQTVFLQFQLLFLLSWLLPSCVSCFVNQSPAFKKPLSFVSLVRSLHTDRY